MTIMADYKPVARIQKSVRLVVQVIGDAYRPAVPEEEQRAWYKQASQNCRTAPSTEYSS